MLTALVVDDEPDILKLIDIALTQGNEWRVVCADSGRRAIELARRELPDVILVDRRLPDGDGLELLAELRLDEATAHIPVILITALTPSSPTELPKGVCGFVEKPFDPLGLSRRIRAILKAGADHEASGERCTTPRKTD